MRVIAGEAKGARLHAPKGMRIRPTLDRVREALFDILAPKVPGATFMDLFAGTGANGIEALSRGAVYCLFADSATSSLKVIRRNLAVTGLQDRAVLRRCVLPKEIHRLADLGVVFDVIFADPPYDFDAYEALIAGIHHAQLLAHEGVIIVEHAARVKAPGEIQAYARSRLATYGDTTLSFFSLGSGTVPKKDPPKRA